MKHKFNLKMASRRPRFKPNVNLSTRRPSSECSTVIKSENLENTVEKPPDNNTSSNNLNDSRESKFNRDSNSAPISRRMIKPSVCLPVRKIKSIIRDNDKTNRNEDTLQNLATAEGNKCLITTDNNNKEMLVNNFKSPFRSPSMKRFDTESTSVSMDDIPNEIWEDNLKNPHSPLKVRQRIKPTPYFKNRRNSTQVCNIFIIYFIPI